MKKTHFYMVIAVMVIFAAQSSAFVENWNYTQGAELSSVSSWVHDWGTGNVQLKDWADGGPVDTYVGQADGGYVDGTYKLDTNYKADYAGKPIIRLEFSTLLGASNSHAYVGLGDFTGGWASGGYEAFNIRAKRFLFGVTDAEGTYYEDYNFDEYFHLKWWDVRVDIDPAANGGDGELDFYYKEVAATTWSQSTALSGLNLHLSAKPEIDDPYTEWDSMFMRLSRTQAGWNGEADINHIEITGVVPEPATMTLLGLGGMMLLKRRKKA